jgi:zinc protease
LGNVGSKRNNPDFFAMVVMNYILGGGGFSSRLFTEIRAKRGFAYSVHSAFDFKKYTGSFSISLQTKNASAREAISIVLDEIKKMQTEPVTDKELEGARKYLTGSFPLRLDTQAKLAGFLAQVEFYGLGVDYADNYASRILAVTKEDVQRVATKYLRPDNYILVVVGNLKEAGFGE